MWTGSHCSGFGAVEGDSIIIRSLSVIPRIQTFESTEPFQLHPALVNLRMIPKHGFPSSVEHDRLEPDTLSYYELSQSITEALGPESKASYGSALILLSVLRGLIYESVHRQLDLDGTKNLVKLKEEDVPFALELTVEFPSLISLAGRLSVSTSSGLPNLTRIYIHEIKAYTIIGILDRERTQKQVVLVSLLLWNLQTSPIDIQEITRSVYENLIRSNFKTVEALADSIAKHVLAFKSDISTKPIQKVTVTVEKPEAVSCAAGAGVEITRSYRDYPLLFKT
ncbi:hypothetical protein MJO28_005249 [Puccinia striiformis f. sp. tritici]|uniref:dihydroneopterin aldolase n=4 Tax=Puccinia striiformis TaxID=27350 RepID=A0A0L0URH0_9BASI|nr:hypothetical protein Pst134EA_009420 [Puccinia striiformis f. sp. tritici]KAI9622910.1 hypothetical protein H4Q26_014849 [Puccinia striiformis f. sp. tritici PST-130]KNE89486.1 hypothetical protein PSTG_17060 [Puccinia striiformis f. sp. tritici PST-78]POW06248.1 hypothetical protein PSHT_10436 [Puccinia striiformis]KAH9458182.1 hypothetical protein Pst134EB_010484 [Puccinia striiformis f. sp. tritici]KAH9468891.1 hypothetical protein Pst134EA_009420 [Puccinia striiformis f. sp. tritici]